jgi:hypothetical protein
MLQTTLFFTHRTKQKMSYGIGNPGPGFEQAQNCGRITGLF